MSTPSLNLDGMTATEKLRLLEKLWDSLADRPGDVPLTDWQRAELDRRLDELDRDGPSGIPWDRVLQEIEGRVR